MGDGKMMMRMANRDHDNDKQFRQTTPENQ
jgi:hypothetical protein